MAWVRVENEMSGKDGFKKPLGLNIPPPIRELGCQKIPTDRKIVKKGMVTSNSNNNGIKNH